MYSPAHQVELAPSATRQQFAVGYFVEWPPDQLDQLLARCAQTSALGPFVFDLIHRLGGSDLRARLVLDLIDRGFVTCARLGDLYIGAWLKNVSDALALCILAITPSPSRLLIAEQWCRQDPARLSVVVDAWHQVHGSDLDGMVDHVWGEAAEKARERDPERFSETMVERLREAGEARSSARSLSQVLSDWLTHDPQGVAKILSAAQDDYRVMWTVRDLSLDPASAAVAVDWARQHPDAAWLVAQLSTGLDEVALALLEALPRNSRLAGALSARTGTGHFRGTGTEFWSGRAQQLEQLAGRASLASSRRWFVAHAANARMRARHAEQQARAFDEGVIPLPFVADR